MKDLLLSKINIKWEEQLKNWFKILKALVLRRTFISFSMNGRKCYWSRNLMKSFKTPWHKASFGSCLGFAKNKLCKNGKWWFIINKNYLECNTLSCKNYLRDKKIKGILNQVHSSILKILLKASRISKT